MACFKKPRDRGGVVRKILVLSIFIIFIGGCTRPHAMQTREEWLYHTTHEFPGKSVDDVLKAGQRLMQLDDRSDVSFYFHNDRMVATRHWMMYAVFSAASGNWVFTLDATPDENGTKASLIIGGSSQSVLPMMAYTPSATAGGGSGIGATATTGPTASIGGWPYIPTYSLFWNRMESLLYKKKEWQTCVWFLYKPQSIVARSFEMEPLCAFADDDIPKSVFVGKLQARFLANQKKVSEAYNPLGNK